jgi:hypothetical protein
MSDLLQILHRLDLPMADLLAYAPFILGKLLENDAQCLWGSILNKIDKLVDDELSDIDLDRGDYRP